MGFRDEIAALWQVILRTKPAVLFDGSFHRVEDRPGLGDEIPQPGFVGARYRPGGVLFLGKNPGKGGASKSAEDAFQFEALQRLRDANAESLRSRFEDLTQILAARVMPTWHVVRHYVQPILSQAGAGLDDIAYINLLKWRSEDTSPAMFDTSWKAHTGIQYSKLVPGFVVAIGSSTRSRFEVLLRRFGARTQEKLCSLERSRSDAMAPPQATIEKIPKIAGDVAAFLNKAAP